MQILRNDLTGISFFEENLNIQRIVSELEMLLGTRIVAGEDLLFFDEIQACPKAIVALRYFYEEMPELHVIAAGSLLEFALSNIPFPVGRIQLISMYPMTFYEYLKAIGNETAATLIMEEPRPLSEPVHNLLNSELKNYLFIGGMPECVRTYVENRKLSDVFEVQSDLIATFRQDFSKYAGRTDKSCLNSVLSSVPQLIGNQIKYSQLAEGFSNPTIKNAFKLLQMAKIFSQVKSASPAGLPLASSASEKKFKAIMLDVGLLANISGIVIGQEFLKSSLSAIFRGAMAEQFVGQEILAAQDSELFYWSREARSSNAETDYLIEKNGKVVPVEVKSGKSGSLKSLHLLMNTYPNIEKSLVFSDASFGSMEDQKITFLPLYYAGSSAL